MDCYQRTHKMARELEETVSSAGIATGSLETMPGLDGGVSVFTVTTDLDQFEITVTRKPHVREIPIQTADQWEDWPSCDEKELQA